MYLPLSPLWGEGWGEGSNKEPKATVKPMKGLYLHIPFCHRRCPYCHFDLTVQKQHRQDFAHLLLREFAQKGLSGPWDTVFFGGGTPLLANLAPLAAAWGDWLGQSTETTVEVNPENLPLLKQQWPLLMGLGVNRMSVGVQAFENTRLKQLGRGHGAKVAVETLGWLLEKQINTGVDLLLCPFAGEARVWRENFRWLGALRPHHVSVYMLENPGHGHWFARHEHSGTFQRLPAFYHRVQAGLAALGYEQYEISNWCLPGYASRHNQIYWRGGVYDALGPSAAAFDGEWRTQNLCGLTAYAEALNQGASPLASAERLTPHRRLREALVLALRTTQGVDAGALFRRFAFGESTTQAVLSDLDKLCRAGLLHRVGEVDTLPPQFYPMADEVLCRLV